MDDQALRAVLELAALDKTDFDGALRRILSADAAVLEIERVNCWALEPDPPAIRCVLGYLRGPDRFESGASIPAERVPGYFAALEAARIIVADDAVRDPRTRDLADEYLIPLGIGSMMDVPVWVGGRLWGVVCHEHVGPPRPWTGDSRDFALSIGHIVSMSLEGRACRRAEDQVETERILLGALGHDLRNPLTAIRAQAERMTLPPSDERTQRIAARIVGSADRMARMIDQLLELTRARIGRAAPLERRRTDLAELNRRAIAELEAAGARAIRLELAGDACGVWDADRLARMVSNLVANAVQHGTPGSEVVVQVDGADPAAVVMRVVNRGAVPAAAVPTIFEPFRRGRGVRNRSGGLGLGLYIAREIVSAHGGTIALESPGPEQVVFRVTLPRAVPDR